MQRTLKDEFIVGNTGQPKQVLWLAVTRTKIKDTQCTKKGNG